MAKPLSNKLYAKGQATARRLLGVSGGTHSAEGVGRYRAAADEDETETGRIVDDDRDDDDDRNDDDDEVEVASFSSSHYSRRAKDNRLLIFRKSGKTKK